MKIRSRDPLKVILKESRKVWSRRPLKVIQKESMKIQLKDPLKASLKEGELEEGYIFSLSLLLQLSNHYFSSPSKLYPSSLSYL